MSIPDTAMALLEAHRAGTAKLTRRAGSFVGECAVDPQPFTEKQAAWFAKLADAAGLPPVEEQSQ